jgi:hypothetical protein
MANFSELFRSTEEQVTPVEATITGELMRIALWDAVD